ncbi:hypothetical protein Psfp_02231 [Pelotomaculum sp. FP]|uniref:Pvc16 family protein n=1 Tax=Pelotomaculum sp. FP TaxID=261474 RepID=UPI001065BB5E|nr:Pvc16 family protein [Pelotomaculum sp. FP]TEB15314.1 hypothetical protein Psfp_02231 [Pelotomaculum sp. FP]
MLRDLDFTLARLLREKVPLPAVGYDISFDRPDEKWAGGISTQKQTVNLYLYDIYENRELRSNEPVLLRRADGTTAIKQPPVRINCVYLVTAWSPSTVDTALEEHHLLSLILSVLLRYQTIPEDVLEGSLAGQEPALPLLAAHPDGPKNSGEFWTAVGNKMKPSFSLMVTVGFGLAELPSGPAVTTRSVSYEQKDYPQTSEEVFHIGGRVVEAGDPETGVSGAKVTVLEKGQVAVTDKEGYYKFPGLTRGTWTFRAESGARLAEAPVTVPAPDGRYVIALS